MKKQIKHLYISDLDGTLLQGNVELSKETVEGINSLLENGMNFSIATARTIASVRHILSPLHITLPIILMNGVCIYDLTKEEYLKVHTLPEEKFLILNQLMEQYSLSPFVYEVKDNQLSTFYTHIKNDGMMEFLQERVDKYQKTFTKINSLSSLDPSNLIYYALLDSKDALEPVYNLIKDMEGLSVAFYKDIYFEGDVYFLEIFSNKATKYNGLNYLRETFSINTITSFGDNLNDLPMFEASDICCAVSNAKEAVKERATHIIKSNMEHGVMSYITKDYLDHKG